jgi:DNA ligase-1
MILDGKVFSRSMKLIPNNHVQELFGKSSFNGLDGELIMGDPNDPLAFRNTTSAVMTIGGRPDVTFHAFDMVHYTEPFFTRFTSMRGYIRGHPLIQVVEHVHVYCANDIMRLEEQYLTKGYEGVMLRSSAGVYKQGRSTLREGGLLKLKRFHDSEAVVLGAIELMHNDNEAKPDERGYMKRSSHQENKRPAGKLGALTVRDLTTGAQFEIGTGFTDADRQRLWNARDTLNGMLVKYRFFPTGSKDKPRFPSFQGFRLPADM